MPTAKEFTISLEDKPGTLGKLCQALAEGGVNILAYQQFPHEKGKALSVSLWTIRTKPRLLWTANAVITKRPKLRRSKWPIVPGSWGVRHLDSAKRGSTSTTVTAEPNPTPTP